MPNIKNIDLIGKNVVIENSSDKTKIGRKGIVVFEAKNIVVLKENVSKKLITIKKSEILDLKKD